MQYEELTRNSKDILITYKVLASASGPCGANVGQICVWDLQQMTCKEVLQHHKFDVVRLAYSRDDRFLISMGIYHLTPENNNFMQQAGTSASDVKRLCESVCRNYHPNIVFKM